MRSKLYVILTIMFLIPLLAVVALVHATSAAALVQPQQGIEVVATNLNNPRGLLFGADGSLYVAEAGRGGSGDCLPNPEGGDPICYGETGSVTRIMSPTTSPTQTRVVTGLASVAVVTGTGALGPQDIAFDQSGNLVVAIGLGADPALREGSTQLMNLGQLVTTTATGDWANWLDLAAYEADVNPDGALPDSNPFSILAVDDGYLVVDAGANALLHVSYTGTITTVAVFPTRTVEFNGSMIPMDAVPTSVAVGPDGAYYVGQLTGFPFPVGGANVYRVVPGEEPTVFESGFTNILSIDFDDAGNLYVLEMATNGLLSGDPTGALIRVSPTGDRTTIASNGLFLPTGMSLGPDNAAYISNFGIFPALGDGPPPAAVSPSGDGPPSGQVVRVSLLHTIYLSTIYKH